MEVQGVCKSTVVRGEDDFASGVLRVTDCHDSIVYALAPLQYASVTCCSDCTVVLGAVGKVSFPRFGLNCVSAFLINTGLLSVFPHMIFSVYLERCLSV